MRTGLMLVALLGTALTASTALADRANDYDNGKPQRSHEVKEGVKEAVSHASERAEKPAAATTTTSSGSARNEKGHRANGDMYDVNAKSASSSKTVTAGHAAMQHSSSRVSSMVKGHKNDEAMADENGSKSSSSKGQKSKGSKAAGNPIWTPAHKSARSFVHMMNDKGQINSSMRGATATAQKNRIGMMAALGPAARFAGKLFRFDGQGGDHSEDAEP